MPDTVILDEARPVVVARPKILLVEDDNSVRRSLQIMLEARHYEVRAYASGLSLLDDGVAPTDALCLICDYQMPALDGFDLLRGLRARGWDRPAILITGFYSEALLSTARADGFRTVLSKPFAEHALIGIVARLQEDRNAAQDRIRRDQR